MDLVGLEVRIPQDLAEHRTFVGDAELLGDLGVEIRRRQQEAELGRADEQHLDAARLREPDHGAQVGGGFGLRQAAQEIVAAMAQQQQARAVLVENGRQALQSCRAHFARHALAHDPPAGEFFELRRIALGLARAGAVGEAVAEGEHHRVGRQRGQPDFLTAA